MRNLKRVLSLALASIMLLGMVATASAATAVPDGAKVENIQSNTSWLRDFVTDSENAGKVLELADPAGKNNLYIVRKGTGGARLEWDKSSPTGLIDSLDATADVNEADEVAGVGGQVADTISFETAEKAGKEYNQLTLKLGKPLEGAKLQRTITVDGAVTVEVEWLKNGEVTSDVYAVEGATYTYRLKTVKAADPATFTGETQIIPENDEGQTYIVTETAMEDENGVAVDENGHMDTNEEGISEGEIIEEEEPAEPEGPYDVTVTGNGGYSVTINGVSATTATVEAGAKVDIVITVDDGYRLASVAANGEAVVTRTVGKTQVYTIDAISEKTDIVVTTQAIDYLALNLVGLLYEGATASTPTVTVSVVGGSAVTGEEITETYGDVMQYMIPEGSTVRVRYANKGASGSGTTSGSTTSDSTILAPDAIVKSGGQLWKIGNTVVTLDAPNYRLSMDRVEVEFTFTMSEDLDLNIGVDKKIKDGNKDAQQIVYVTSKGGVAATLVDTSDSNKEYKLAKDATIQVPAGHIWTITVTDKGTGDVVKLTSWTALDLEKDTAVSGVGGFYNDTVLASCYFVAPDRNIAVSGDTAMWTSEGNGNSYYVPAGDTITLKYQKDPYYGGTLNNSGEPASLRALGSDGFIALTEADYTTNKTVAVKSVIAEGGTYTVNAATNIGLAVKFTLDDDVKADLEYTDQWAGGTKTQELTSGTWYVTGYVERDHVDASKAALAANSDLTLKFSQKNVVADKVVGNNQDTVMGISGGKAIANTQKLATATYITESGIWDGAEFEAWTRVESKDIDEGYRVRYNGLVATQIFNDAYRIEPIKSGVDDTVTVGEVTATVAREAGVFFLSPELIKGIDGTNFKFLVIGGNGATYNAGDRTNDTIGEGDWSTTDKDTAITIDGYEIQMNKKPGEAGDELNPWLSGGAPVNAWAAFDSIEVVDGVVKLEAVEK